MTTNFVRAGYQEVIDLNTETNTVSIVGLHTPTGDVPVKMLKPFWDAYQKVRYKGCKISLIPSARLPADISQVGYEAGTQPIDPRDLLNPILFHGCHGNDMGSILNQFYSGQDPSAGSVTNLTRNFGSSVEQNIHATNYGSEQLEALYYKAMVDGTWYKSSPQRGFSKNLRPLVYSLAANLSLNSASSNVDTHKDRLTPYVHDSLYDADGEPVASAEGTMGFSSDWNGDNTGNGTVYAHYPQGLAGQYSYPGAGSYSISSDYDDTFMQIMTPRLQRLGWIDTRQIVAEPKVSQSFSDVTDPEEFLEQVNLSNGLFYVNKQSVPTHIPKIFMGMILLPPSYKAKIYMRLVISHYFEFSKYRGMSMQEPNRGMVNHCLAHSMWFTQIGSDKNGADRESDGNDGDVGDTKDEPSYGGEFKS